MLALLAEALESDGHLVLKSSGDAETLIVSTVLDYACINNVTLVAADKNLFIMLLYFWNTGMGRVIMKSEASKKHSATEHNIGELSLFPVCCSGKGVFLLFD